MLDLIDRLADLPAAKRAGLDSWFFWNSGSEAVEASIKLARQATGKPNIIVANLGYHGRTFGTMGLTTSGTIYRSGFMAPSSGVFVAPFPYIINGPYGPDYEYWDNSTKQKISECSYWGYASADLAARDTARCLDTIALMLRTQTAPSETAAILLEPVQGEGGYVPCPPGFLKGLKDICKQNGMLLIVDEVQTGFGRTGSMFATDWLDRGEVQPDVLVMAKGIANGFPLSAIATRSDLSVKQPPGSMGGTYGANAVSCAAALAVLDAFETEGVLEGMPEGERIIRKKLTELDEAVPGVLREVRGKGYMIGVELNTPPGRQPGWAAKEVALTCAERGLLVLSCGPYDTVRLIPPLNASSEELSQGMDIFGSAVTTVTEMAEPEVGS